MEGGGLPAPNSRLTQTGFIMPMTFVFFVFFVVKTNHELLGNHEINSTIFRLPANSALVLPNTQQEISGSFADLFSPFISKKVHQ